MLLWWHFKKSFCRCWEEIAFLLSSFDFWEKVASRVVLLKLEGILAVRSGSKPVCAVVVSAWRLPLLGSLKRQGMSFAPDIGTSETHQYSKASNVKLIYHMLRGSRAQPWGFSCPELGLGYLPQFAVKFFPIHQVGWNWSDILFGQTSVVLTRRSRETSRTQ